MFLKLNKRINFVEIENMTHKNSLILLFQISRTHFLREVSQTYEAKKNIRWRFDLKKQILESGLKKFCLFVLR